ncbi:MAG: aspartate aminotransferase family protein [Aestuariivirga sp.]|uniref:aspartate aminotransferase family protein n=1 Tax=Aestuariivirga sp. TaxID=2650926 RepID=UPI0038CF7257
MISPVLPTYARAKVAFERGEGTRVYTAEGESYLDFGAGVAVTSCGHCHPHLVAALTEQASKIWHTSNLYQMPGQEKLARRLIEHSFADTVFFTNSGAEALECSIKMARKYQSAIGHPERYRLITFEGAFHGRTLATIAAGGQAKYLEGFGPKVDGFDQVPFGDHEALKAAIGPATAGILIEPVQGEGGIRPVPPQCLRGLRALCDAHGLLLIYDEVQCGIGRTGKLFAYEWSGAQPDIMAIAKGIGGGFPIGACLATEKAAQGMTAGTHGSTFGGNPLGTAVANAVLDVMLAPGFLESVQQRALTLKQKLASLKDRHPEVIAEVRGEGLMMGLKCKVPNTALQQAALDQHLLVIGAGDNVVRLLPPLIVSDADIAEAVDKLDRACRAIAAKSAA